jgi:phosphinothricin acetyltransferase
VGAARGVDLTPPLIRPAEPRDFPAVLTIYNHYIVHSHVTFDVRPFELSEREAWFAQFADTGRSRMFVADDDAGLAGYACSTSFRPKPAYATSVETTVYVHPERLGRGIGRLLYEPLLEALGTEDVHRAYAVIVLPNPASIRLHEELGFSFAATLREVGRKFDKYWDVSWYERSLP